MLMCSTPHWGIVEKADEKGGVLWWHTQAQFEK